MDILKLIVVFASFAMFVIICGLCVVCVALLKRFEKRTQDAASPRTRRPSPLSRFDYRKELEQFVVDEMRPRRSPNFEQPAMENGQKFLVTAEVHCPIAGPDVEF